MSGAGAGRGKSDPVRGGDGVNLHSRRVSGAGGMGSRGQGWGKQNLVPTRPVAMPMYVQIFVKNELNF